MKYKISQSVILSSVWFATPLVPGGRTRMYVVDDFGNFYEVDRPAFNRFFAG